MAHRADKVRPALLSSFFFADARLGSFLDGLRVNNLARSEVGEDVVLHFKDMRRQLFAKTGQGVVLTEILREENEEVKHVVVFV